MYLKLKKLRKSKKISMQQMADMLCIAKSYYSLIENGKRKLSYEMAFKISKILKYKPDYIFYEDINKNSSFVEFNK